MTPDRDQSIERLLRRARASDQQAPDHCPDAETLAALADDTLTAPARREVEAHVADCHRCQALTAAMVRAEASTGTPVDERAGEVPAWRRRALNWLVPAAAAATAVALWVIVPGQRTPLPEQPAPEPQIVATPPAAPPEAAPSEPLQAPSADARADAPARGREGDVGFERGAPAAPPAAAPPQASLKSEESPVAGGLQPSGRETGRSESAPREQEQLRNQQATAPAAACAAADAAGTRAGLSFDVVSPNPRIRWRVGPGSLLQHTADGGATWAQQQTGGSAELIAGSSPAPEVCWLVGRGGIVLRTTDGGRQWQRTSFPEAADLTAVTASTALNATVVLADGRRLATTDGGRTWAPVRE